MGTNKQTRTKEKMIMEERKKYEKRHTQTYKNERDRERKKNS